VTFSSPFAPRLIRCGLKTPASFVERARAATMPDIKMSGQIEWLDSKHQAARRSRRSLQRFRLFSIPISSEQADFRARELLRFFAVGAKIH
jgi:hypothetical protein